ncbi:MAG TPA: hypothetical protein VHM90_00435 [Phycisphaerae bacterium]|nr:hypothetical protein [Phycisphaerae bacterium]
MILVGLIAIFVLIPIIVSVTVVLARRPAPRGFEVVQDEAADRC